MGVRVVLAAALAAIVTPLGAGATRPAVRGLVLTVTSDGFVATVNTATGRVRHLAAGETPSWSPDGRRIVYVDADLANVFVADADGANITQLTHGSGHVHPVWSPDGKRIAVLEGRIVCGARRLDVILLDADGGGRVQLTSDRRVKTDLSWSPNGTAILYRDTEGLVTVVDLAGNRNVIAVGARDPVWSPDGKRIAYIGGTTRLVIANADGSNPQTYFRHGVDRELGRPAWSPDGRSIAFGFGGGTATWNRIEVLDVHTGRVRGLTRPRGHVDVGPVWSPDGKWIAFSREHNGKNDPRIAVIARAGGAVRVLGSRIRRVLHWRPRAT